MEKENYFLGSVGRVEAFRETDNGLELAFISKTLTDSGINTSNTADDIRAGQGAPIVTRFYHDASVEITLTDVMFKPEYVEAQLGAKFTEGVGAEAFLSEELKAGTGTGNKGKITLKKGKPLPLGAGCVNSDEIPVWFTEIGKNDWKIAKGTANSYEVEDENLVSGKKYCVRYLAESLFARAAEVTADILPQELHLIITIPLYAGDACAASKGQLAGEVQFDIPRFRLNGAQDFAAAMSSNQTMSLAGSAMAQLNGCDNSGLLYTMRILKTSEEEGGVKGKYEYLKAEDEFNHPEEIPHIYGVKSDLNTDLISNGLLMFPTGALNDLGEWKTVGTYTVSLGSGTDILSTIVTIAA